MRTFLLFFVSLFFTAALFGQITHSENFDSYPLGEGITSLDPEFWELWPQDPNANPVQDATISDVQAASGNNSLYLPGGQDIDILHVFGGDQYTSGTFRVAFDILITEGRNSYFNFQGSDLIPSDGNWVLQCFLRETGIFEVDNGQQIVFTNAFTPNEWMNIELEINLTENLWRMFVNGDCLGSFVNADENNQIYAMNLFPLDGNSDAYVDNVEFEHNPDAASVDVQIDAIAVGAVDVDGGIGVNQSDFFGIVGTQQNLELNVGNIGLDNIESFTLELEGPGISFTEDFSFVLPPQTLAPIQVEVPYVYTPGTEVALMRIRNVNGATDDNTCNNVTPLTLTGFIPDPDKKVWVEETTGRAAELSPIGHVYMNYMQNKYPDQFVGISVHNDAFGLDPMTNEEWNLALELLPIADFQRLVWTERDPDLLNFAENIEETFVNSAVTEPILSLSHGASFDPETRNLIVQVTTDFFLVAIRDNTRLLVGLTEDGVIGTNAGFAQQNAFSGGGQGPMGGFETLANPVPADEMIYNRVARMLLTPTLGLEGAYADVEGRTITHTFSAIVPDDFNIDNMSIVSSFIGQDGRSFNAEKTTVFEAEQNGLSSTIDPVLDQGISVYPNPTNGVANITLEFEQPKDISMELADALGRTIRLENLGTISNKVVRNFDGSDLDAGVYYLRFRNGEEITVKKLIITE